MAGLSLVILMFGTGSPAAQVVPDDGVRRAITGCPFGTTGALIALSPVGKISGAHINPVVTVGFRLMGRLELKVTLSYILAQLAGGVLGPLPLLAWGEMGRSVAFGATFPGPEYGILTAFMGEVVTTFAMIPLLATFLAYRKFRPYTLALFPLLYSLIVWTEAPISGTSTNPARSLGPAVIRAVPGVVALLDRPAAGDSPGPSDVRFPGQAN